MPKEIVNKPGKLEGHEWAIIKTHTIEGQKMLERVGGFMSEVGEIVRSSHERWDGGGYPDGLRGGQIPLEARIVSCCDAYNAMTTTRSYRTAMPTAAALAELRRNAGTQFDRQVVDALVRVAGEPAEHSLPPAAAVGTEGGRPGPPDPPASYGDPMLAIIAGASTVHLTESAGCSTMHLPPNRL